MHSSGWRSRAATARARFRATISTRPDCEAVAVGQHTEFPGGGVSAGSVDDEPVAFAQERFHGIPEHADDPQVPGVRAGILAQHRIGQVPPRAFPRHRLVASKASGGGALELRDFGNRGAGRRAAPLALGRAARRHDGVAQLPRFAAEEVRERLRITVRDTRIVLAVLLGLSMGVNGLLSHGLAQRESMAVLVPAVSDPAWTVGETWAGRRRSRTGSTRRSASAGPRLVGPCETRLRSS